MFDAGTWQIRIDPYLRCPCDDLSQQIAMLRLIRAHWRMLEQLLSLQMLLRYPHTTSQVVTLSKPRPRLWTHSVWQIQIMVSTRLVTSSSPPYFSFVILLVYYRIYAEDGAIPSKTPAAPADPFLGRIKARFVPPPHTAKTVKRSIAKTENIKDRTSTSLFLTPFSQTPMGDADKLAILNRTGPGSTPQEPLALVAKMSDSERSALESGGRDGLDSESSFTDTLVITDPNYSKRRLVTSSSLPTSHLHEFC